MIFDALKLQLRVTRAIAATGFGVTYKLGKGGFNPADKTPGAQCDCSGFLSWVAGISRFQGDKNKPWSKHLEWIETSAMVEDARGAQRLFKIIDKPVPGCFIAYRDRRVLGIPRQGHCGLVVGSESDPLCVDCSTGRFKRAVGKVRRASFWLGRGGCCFVFKEDLI